MTKSKVSLNEARRPITEKMREEILQLRAQGLSANPIAAKVGIGARRVLRILHREGLAIPPRRPVSPEKIAAIDADIRARKLFLCAIAKKHGVGLRKVSERKLAILGPAPLKSCWPPLQSKFSQIDAALYVPTAEEYFLAIVKKCVDATAEKYLREASYDYDEVLQARKSLKRDLSPILELFDAGLRNGLTLYLSDAARRSDLAN